MTTEHEVNPSDMNEIAIKEQANFFIPDLDIEEEELNIIRNLIDKGDFKRAFSRTFKLRKKIDNQFYILLKFLSQI